MIDLSKKYEHFSARLRQAMEARNLTNEELASRIDSHTVTISKLRRGKIALDDEWRAKIADAFAMDEQVLFGDSELPDPAPMEMFHRRRKPGPKPLNDNQDLPIFGLAAGSQSGHLVMTNEVIETVPCPPGLRKVAGAYALRTKGDSMIPRYFPNDILYINPNQDVMAGDHVILQIRMHDGDGTETWIKRYDGQTNDEVLASQYNPSTKMSFRRRYVINIHRVLPINELYPIS
ncbi:phage repressor protein C with HTH and peptisase S24 domain [Neorhizobium huautlense]|uniref:Phage repressor protein C with HTH and peptisase S24 domain n=1 Tax=Neorhizobium huautlense TaxID=67774 RepID=A0ABT9PTU4_9HYPH|nr:XRE family transcriptional regulator [Neorhizobium huautlense]MDP9837576.1 phage repressor protein C with HTH and peptisase S24 domain [Neorhizobium huautlense]